MVSENVNEVRWYIVPRFFLEKLHNLLRFCVHFAKKFANHALSELILLRADLRGTTFDVDIRVQEYMCCSPPPPPTLDFSNLIYKLEKLLDIG